MHDGILADRGRPRAPAGTYGLCFLIALVFATGCAARSDEADAGRLFERSLAIMEERGLSIVPDESGAAEMIARENAAEWNPFAQAAELKRQAASVTLAEDGNGRRGEAVLLIELKPEAAKEMLKRRLLAELAAVGNESGALLPDGENEDRSDLARRIGERIAKAEEELTALLDAAEVETVIRMRVDLESAVPSGLQMDTRIVRPAEMSSVGRNAAASAGAAAAADGTESEGPDGAGRNAEPHVVQETISDSFKIM